MRVPRIVGLPLRFPGSMVMIYPKDGAILHNHSAFIVNAEAHDVVVESYLVEKRKHHITLDVPKDVPPGKYTVEADMVARYEFEVDTTRAVAGWEAEVERNLAARTLPAGVVPAEARPAEAVPAGPAADAGRLSLSGVESSMKLPRVSSYPLMIWSRSTLPCVGQTYCWWRRSPQPSWMRCGRSWTYRSTAGRTSRKPASRIFASGCRKPDVVQYTNP